MSCINVRYDNLCGAMDDRFPLRINPAVENIDSTASLDGEMARYILVILAMFGNWTAWAFQKLRDSMVCSGGIQIQI